MLWFCYFIQHTDILEAMLNERYMGYRYGSSQASFDKIFEPVSISICDAPLLHFIHT